MSSSEPTANGADLFSAQAVNYSRFRPSYPQSVYDLILAALPEPHQRRLAVDVATGNGQCAVQLAQYFDAVLATDGNPQQLAHAAPAPRGNVTYSLCDAHSIPARDGSVDLVTAASALHWFSLPRFWTECRRVLAPHGCLVAWAIPLGSSTLRVPAAPAAAPGVQAALHWLHEDTLGECWDARKRLVDDLYRDATPSLHEFASVLCRQLSMRVPLSVEGLVGYASSWSAYSLYRQRHPQAPDPLAEFRQRLAAALQAQGLEPDGEAIIEADIPVILILCQFPKPLKDAAPAAPAAV